MMTLLAWGVVLGMGFILGMKMIPAYTEYFGVKNVLKTLVREQAGAPVTDIRESFDKRAVIENISAVKGGDLDIEQDARGTTIAVSYQKIIPLIANASLMFDFHAEEHRGGAGQ